MLRPRPYQKPHPPLIRACISEASTIAMAKIGRPVMLGIMPVESLAARLSAYRDTMLGAGFDEQATESALDQCWASRNVFVANSYGEAREAAERGFTRERRHFGEARRLYNPGGGPPQMGSGTSSVPENLPMSFIMGTPRQVADEIAAMEGRRCAQYNAEVQHGRDGHTAGAGVDEALRRKGATAAARTLTVRQALPLDMLTSREFEHNTC